MESILDRDKLEGEILKSEIPPAPYNQTEMIYSVLLNFHRIGV